MNKPKIDLPKDEKILFESGPAILTNQRLLANWKGGDGKASDEALIKDIESFQKFNGGQEFRIGPALQFGAAGLTLTLVEFVIPDLPTIASGVLFLLGAIGIVTCVYMVLSSLLRVRPNTTIFFKIRGTLQDPNTRIVVSFPGHENREAEELTRRFARAKRGL